jgi:pyruvate dehydrogenase E1 component beta subunit/pre-rRNA-processing protein TSR1
MYEIEHRGPEDLDYEDEVEYGVEVKLRERYDKY